MGDDVRNRGEHEKVFGKILQLTFGFLSCATDLYNVTQCFGSALQECFAFLFRDRWKSCKWISLTYGVFHHTKGIVLNCTRFTETSLHQQVVCRYITDSNVSLTLVVSDEARNVLKQQTRKTLFPWVAFSPLRRKWKNSFRLVNVKLFMLMLPFSVFCEFSTS